ncbi:hypothetical protein VE03_01146 [Pseudogymnoascus sp. 23342-1-I1]|nr:hypothetical protein VE03_01146 [Pseudogymnoascus sp. 23342-1-I1]
MTSSSPPSQWQKGDLWDTDPQTFVAREAVKRLDLTKCYLTDDAIMKLLVNKRERTITGINISRFNETEFVKNGFLRSRHKGRGAPALAPDGTVMTVVAGAHHGSTIVLNGGNGSLPAGNWSIENYQAKSDHPGYKEWLSKIKRTNVDALRAGIPLMSINATLTSPPRRVQQIISESEENKDDLQEKKEDSPYPNAKGLTNEVQPSNAEDPKLQGQPNNAKGLTNEVKPSNSEDLKSHSQLNNAEKVENEGQKRIPASRSATPQDPSEETPSEYATLSSIYSEITTSSPATSEPAHSEAGPSGAATSEAATSNPAASRPVTSTPAASKTAFAGPAALKPFLSQLGTPDRALSMPATSVPVVSQPATPERALSEPASSEPVITGPATLQPINSQPTTLEPTVSESVTPEPVPSDITASEPVLEPATSGPAASRSVSSKPMNSEPATSRPVFSEPAAFGSATLGQAISETVVLKPTVSGASQPVGSESVAPEPTIPDLVTPETSAPEPTPTKPTTKPEALTPVTAEIAIDPPASNPASSVRQKSASPAPVLGLGIKTGLMEQTPPKHSTSMFHQKQFIPRQPSLEIRETPPPPPAHHAVHSQAYMLSPEGSKMNHNHATISTERYNLRHPPTTQPAFTTGQSSIFQSPPPTPASSGILKRKATEPLDRMITFYVGEGKPGDMATFNFSASKLAENAPGFYEQFKGTGRRVRNINGPVYDIVENPKLFEAMLVWIDKKVVMRTSYLAPYDLECYYLDLYLAAVNYQLPGLSNAIIDELYDWHSSGGVYFQMIDKVYQMTQPGYGLRRFYFGCMMALSIEEFEATSIEQPAVIVDLFAVKRATWDGMKAKEAYHDA